MASVASTAPTRRSTRSAPSVARKDVTDLVTVVSGPQTPSPSKAYAQHRDGDFNPHGPTPHAARVIQHVNTKDPLNKTEKDAVEAAMDKYGPKDRCIITREKVYNFCHLVARQTSSAQHLTERWGCKEPLDVNGPTNVVKEDPTKHYMMDNKQLVSIPERGLVVQIRQKYLALNRKKEKPKPFEELFGTIPDGGWTYQVLPLDVDPYKHIFRHKLKKGETPGDYDSTGEYEDHAYPYSNLTFPTHAHPLCALWHAGVELNKLSPSRHQEIRDKLTAENAKEMADSIRDIVALYKIWVLPDSETPEPLTHDSGNEDTDESPQDDSALLDVFQSASAPEEGVVLDADDSHSPPIVFGGPSVAGMLPVVDDGPALDADPSLSIPGSSSNLPPNIPLPISETLSEPARHYSLSGDATSNTGKGKKRKMSESPLTSDGPLVTGGSSPTQRVQRSQKFLRTGGDEVEPTASAGSRIPAPKFETQSERGTTSTKQPTKQPGEGTVTQADKWEGYATFRASSKRGEFSGAPKAKARDEGKEKALPEPKIRADPVIQIPSKPRIRPASNNLRSRPDIGKIDLIPYRGGNTLVSAASSSSSTRTISTLPRRPETSGMARPGNSGNEARSSGIPVGSTFARAGRTGGAGSTSGNRMELLTSARNASMVGGAGSHNSASQASTARRTLPGGSDGGDHRSQQRRAPALDGAGASNSGEQASTSRVAGGSGSGSASVATARTVESNSSRMKKLSLGPDQKDVDEKGQ